ncbi:MAG TPA: glycosyltransferase [Bacteroidia bacterium]|nr:glycosyltransferase [Bacteroidia bacterium]
MGKRFVTIFPICENVHLTKDLGQIPYFLHKLHGYDSTIVCYKNSEHYDNITSEVKGLKIDFIENTGRLSFLERGVLKYIYKNAKQIDVLNLYIFSKFTFVYGILYKKLNPKGFLFLKLDGYNETFAAGNKIAHSTNPIKNSILKYLEKSFLKKVDLVTIENQEGEKLVQKMFPSIASKVMYLPVGVNDLFLNEVFTNKQKSFKEKENIILTVGRVGEEIKNQKMILRALTKTDMKDWKMVFVGPVNDSFKLYFNELCIKFPYLKEKVIFTGNISNRVELYEWYNKSKVFCMTSLKESFCHSISEALYFGNYIIGTEGIMSMKDVTDNGKYGVTLKSDDDAALAATFQKLIDDDSQLSALYPEIVNFSRKYFVWSNIIGKVNEQINNNK